MWLLGTGRDEANELDWLVISGLTVFCNKLLGPFRDPGPVPILRCCCHTCEWLLVAYGSCGRCWRGAPQPWRRRSFKRCNVSFIVKGLWSQRDLKDVMILVGVGIWVLFSATETWDRKRKHVLQLLISFALPPLLVAVGCGERRTSFFPIRTGNQFLHLASKWCLQPLQFPSALQWKAESSTWSSRWPAAVRSSLQLNVPCCRATPWRPRISSKPWSMQLCRPCDDSRVNWSDAMRRQGPRSLRWRNYWKDVVYKWLGWSKMHKF